MLIIVGQGRLPDAMWPISSGPRAKARRLLERSSGVLNGASSRRESPNSCAIRLWRLSSVIRAKKRSSPCARLGREKPVLDGSVSRAIFRNGYRSSCQFSANRDRWVINWSVGVSLRYCARLRFSCRHASRTTSGVNRASGWVSSRK